MEIVDVGRSDKSQKNERCGSGSWTADHKIMADNTASSLYPCKFNASGKQVGDRKRYVQPRREESFAPKRVYNPPENPLERYTTYVRSYLKVGPSEMRVCRSQPVRPSAALERSHDKFAEDTTNKLSYKPVWQVVRAKPICQPRRRAISPHRRMETTTTVRQDYGQKSGERAEMVVPRGNIRSSKAPLEDKTTANLSFLCPGPTEPSPNFKPPPRYSLPSEPLSTETTHKLSYQPFSLPAKRDVWPWQEKPHYKAPERKMSESTTYRESYLPESPGQGLRKPFLPIAAGNILADEHTPAMSSGIKTIYRESYRESNSSRVHPISPSNNISLPLGKISADTTNKLSFQGIRAEKREPILPRARGILLGDGGPIHTETTNRREFVEKSALRPDPVIPCSNIRTPAESPFDGETTARLSYVDPGPVQVAPTFKPLLRYQRPTEQIESDTIQKLSYQVWNRVKSVEEEDKKLKLGRRRSTEEAAPVPMCTDTVYQMSYAPPGYYLDEEVSREPGSPCHAANNQEPKE